jgi:RNA polymerase sigma-70 factor (ECF subfamily)
MPLPADRFLPLFLACQNDLRAFIGAMVRDTALREDLFQEVSMILWRKFDTYDPARAFGAWARGIATRKILESHRVSARLPQAIPPEVLEAVAEGFNRVEQEEEAQTWQERERALNACLDLLPASSKEWVNDICFTYVLFALAGFTIQIPFWGMVFILMLAYYADYIIKRQ